MEWRIEADLYKATSVEDINGKPIPSFRLKSIFLKSTANRIFPGGTWCSGTTPAQHAGGPGLNPLCAHMFAGIARNCATTENHATDEQILPAVFEPVTYGS